MSRWGWPAMRLIAANTMIRRRDWDCIRTISCPSKLPSGTFPMFDVAFVLIYFSQSWKVFSASYKLKHVASPRIIAVAKIEE
jgi:hypothetical protein